MIVCSLFISGNRSELIEKQNNLEKKQSEYSKKKVSVDMAKKSLESDRCALCDENLTTASREKLTTKQETDIQQDNDVHDEINKIKKMLSNSEENQYDTIIELSEEIEKLKDRISQSNIKIQNLEEGLSDAPITHETLRKLIKKQLEAENETKTKNGFMDENKNKIIENENAKKIIDDLIKKSDEKNDQKDLLHREEILTGKIIAALEASKQELIDDARLQVENESNSMHKKINHIQAETIKINKEFQVNISDQHGADIDTSSGGYQLVAYALMHGLKNATGHDAPMFIDAPLSTLDDDNSLLVLKAFPAMSKQIILMSTPKDLSDHLSKEGIGDLIGKYYQLDKNNELNTEIRESNE